METFPIDGKSLTLEQVTLVSRRQSRAELAPAARARMSASRAVLEKLIAGGTAMYGVNTGFGKLKDVRIPPEKLTLLQENLIHSHCSGVGASLPEETVRAILLLRANTLAQGPSAIRPEVVDTLLGMLAADLLPEIPSQGSVCASGDLAPLAHLALATMGEGAVRYRGELMPAAAAFRQAKLTPIRFGPKEGLSVINGTQVPPPSVVWRRHGPATFSPAPTSPRRCRSRPCAAPRPPSTNASTSCDPTGARSTPPRTSDAFSPTAASWIPTGTAIGSRTATPCAVFPRSTEPSGIPSGTFVPS